jgi:hypothetical protein
MNATYTPEQIDEQLAEAKRCKTFIDILNGDTPCLGVTRGFLDGALNVGLSAAVRLGEIVEQLRAALDASVKLQSHYAMLLNDWDGGERMRFESSAAWMERLAKVNAEKADA